MLPAAEEIVRLHDGDVVQWRAQAPGAAPAGDDLRSLVRAEHFCNFTLWNLEDDARMRDRGDAFVAEAKGGVTDIEAATIAKLEEALGVS